MDRRSIAVTSLALTLVLAMALPMGTLAKGRPTVEATNNLSVPTIMLDGGSFTNVVCGADAFSALVPPIDDPEVTSDDYPLDGYLISPLDYYYVQGVHKWQAPCNNSTAPVEVTAGWGDNLSGDAKLKVGSPIRVELGLFYDSSTSPVNGYTVIKLDPDALDREAPYGTLATGDMVNGFTATPTAFTTLRVFDTGAWLTITNADGVKVVNEDATAEINATGNVVYGYNLRVTATGTYLITYTVPTAFVMDTDAGTVAEDKHSVSLQIIVTGGGGGGGVKPPRP